MNRDLEIKIRMEEKEKGARRKEFTRKKMEKKKYKSGALYRPSQ